MPKWYLDKPEEGNESDFYFLTAFNDLSTCRLFETGGIPWTAIMQYGQEKKYPDMESFVTVLRLMDRHWMDWKAQELEKSRGK